MIMGIGFRLPAASNAEARRVSNRLGFGGRILH